MAYTNVLLKHNLYFLPKNCGIHFVAGLGIFSEYTYPYRILYIQIKLHVLSFLPRSGEKRYQVARISYEGMAGNGWAHSEY